MVIIWVVFKATRRERSTKKGDMDKEGAGRWQSKCTVRNVEKELTLFSTVSSTPCTTSQSPDHNPGREKLLLYLSFKAENQTQDCLTHTRAHIFLWQGFSKHRTCLEAQVSVINQFLLSSCKHSTPGHYRIKGNELLTYVQLLLNNTSLLETMKYTTLSMKTLLFLPFWFIIFLTFYHLFLCLIRHSKSNFAFLKNICDS